MPLRILISITLGLLALVVLTCSSKAQHSSDTAIDTTQQVEDKVGYVFFQTDVDSFYVVVDENFEQASYISSQDSLGLSPGRHVVRIIKRYYVDRVFNVHPKSGYKGVMVFGMMPFEDTKDQKKRSSYPRLHWEANAIVKTDPEADLYIGETFLGKGIGMIDSTGTFEIQSRFPSGQILHQTISTQKQLTPFQVYELHHRPSRKTSLLLSFLPGATQIYQREKVKGYALLASTLIGTGLAVKFHVDFSGKYKMYKRTKKDYNSTYDPASAFELGNLAETQLNEASRLANLRDGFLYGSLAIYIYNLVDALIKPDYGYRKEISFDPYINFEQKGINILGVRGQYQF